MKYEVSFDPELNTFYYDLLWKDISTPLRKKVKRDFILSVIIFALSIIITNFSFLGVIILFVALAMFISALQQQKWYRLFKEQHYQKNERDIARHQKEPYNLTWQFDEDHLMYSTVAIETKIMWNALPYYKLKNSVLFIYVDEEAERFFMIGERQIGKDEFEKVAQFVKNKISELP